MSDWLLSDWLTHSLRIYLQYSSQSKNSSSYTLIVNDIGTGTQTEKDDKGNTISTMPTKIFAAANEAAAG